MKKIIYVLIVTFLTTMTTFTQIDRKQPPKPLPEKPVNFGRIDNFSLSNGVKVIVVENHKLPIVHIDLTLNIPAVKQGEVAGYLNMFESMLRAGTQNYSKEELGEKIDCLGSDFYAGSTYVGVSALKKQLVPSLEIFKELIYKATFFNQTELDKLKKQSITALVATDRNPDAISQRGQRVLLYGKKDAWGDYGTEKTINKIYLSDFSNYYNTYFKPNIVYISIVGDSTFSEAKALAEECFSTWTPGKVQQNLPKLKKHTSGMKIAFVDLPTAAQSSINVLRLAELRESDKNYFSSILRNNILGNGASGRLFKDIREKHGRTYGTYSILRDNNKRLGNFGAYAKVRNDVTDSAVIEIVRNIKNITSQTSAEEKVSITKSEYAENFALGFEKSETIARYIKTQMIENLPSNFYENYLSNLNKISAQQIPKSLKQVIDPDNLIILIVGKGEEILPRLEKLRYPLEYYDKYGNPILKSNVKKVAEGVNLAQVLNKYYNAIAGSKSKMEKITSVVTEAEMTLPQSPVPISVVYKFKSPNKIIAIISAMGQTMKQEFDGKEGFSTIGNLPEEQVDKFKAQKGYFPELNYTEERAILDGIENIEGKESYKIVVTDGGNRKNIYYDLHSGLKIKEDTQSENGGLAVTDFTEYKEFDGYKLPTKIVTSITNLESSNIELMTQNVKNYLANPSLTEADFKP